MSAVIDKDGWVVDEDTGRPLCGNKMYHDSEGVCVDEDGHRGSCSFQTVPVRRVSRDEMLEAFRSKARAYANEATTDRR